MKKLLITILIGIIIIGSIYLFIPQKTLATTEVEFTSSQDWVVPTGVTLVDVFIVGGGSGGGAWSCGINGGGGGYTKSYFGVSVTPNETISITIGTGGAGNDCMGVSGGYSQFKDATYKADGADANTFSGGSGGGKQCGYGNTSGNGGSDGSAGYGGNGCPLGGGGTGQGTTTRKFAEPAGDLYAGGGGGGGFGAGAGAGGVGGGGNGTGGIGDNATPNSGGGGGGGGSGGSGGNGADGIVIVRYTEATTEAPAKSIVNFVSGKVNFSSGKINF